MINSVSQLILGAALLTNIFLMATSDVAALGSKEARNMCGGMMGLACDEGSYCEYEVGTCGAADQTGMCAPRTEMCTREYRPVCGCDGKTYGNACTAAAEGVSLVSEGECPKAN